MPEGYTVTQLCALAKLRLYTSSITYFSHRWAGWSKKEDFLSWIQSVQSHERRKMIEEISRIKGVIDKFQEGYLNRDLEAIDDDIFFPHDLSTRPAIFRIMVRTSFWYDRVENPR